MKKYITYISLIILLLCCINFNFEVEGSKVLRVYGIVELDGDPVENANVTVTNLDDGFSVDDTTNSNGKYEIFITANDHDNFKVEAKYGDDAKDKDWFEVQPSKNDYEINFNLEEKTTIIIIEETFISTFEGIWERIINLNFMDWLYLLIIILIIVIILKLIFSGWNNNNNNRGRDQDIIIINDGKGKRLR